MISNSWQDVFTRRLATIVGSSTSSSGFIAPSSQAQPGVVFLTAVETRVSSTRAAAALKSLLVDLDLQLGPEER